MARKAHEATEDRRRMVAELIGRGMPRATIASVLKIHVQTLDKHYRAELETGADIATAQVAGKLFAQCMTDKADMPTTVARIFWMKTHGWRESQVISHEGRDGAAIGDTVNNVHFYRLEIPDNGRDPELAAKRQYVAAPHLMIEAQPIETPPMEA